MKRRWFTALLAVCLLIIGIPAAAQDASPTLEGNPNFPAPAFPDGLEWINVSRPLTLDDLQGKVTILDFWTYGCINCIHMIPTLKQLESKYGDALAVVGVHSAKFDNEGQTENIRQIVQRYDLEHPVINDSAFVTWNTYSMYGVNAWPTFVIIDPRGNLFAVQAGEIPFEVFDRVVGGMIAHFDGLGEINRQPLPIDLEAAARPNSALSYPGKVMVDPAGGRLFIADSSHNRIIITDLGTYEILDVIGTGAVGFEDGDYTTATFAKPQGMALDGSTLYVADTNNHAIRAVNLVERTVETIAGNGERGFNTTNATTLDEAVLSSPWDLEMGDDGILYIAMAGTHQLWALLLDEGVVQPVVGSGREGLVEGNFAQAQLAQPSGLYYRDGVLYFADSESSSIRAADTTNSRTATLAGPTTNNLFDFDDIDGALGTSRLQHPLGVVGGEDGLLYVADTYNSKIKVLNPETLEITTLAGAGSPGGFADGALNEAQFYEPGGLDYADGKLYVADTNNQAIRVIDLEAGTVSTVAFPNPELLQINGQITVVGGSRGVQIELPEQTVAAGEGEIALHIVLPEGYKLNPNIPLTAAWSSLGEAVAITEENQRQSLSAPEIPITVPVTLSEGSATVTGELTVYYCEAVQESLCFIDEATVNVRVSVSADGSGTTIQIMRDITPPEVTVGGL